MQGVRYTSRITYDSRLNALITYLGHSQYVPFKRLCEILRDVFNLNISEGTVHNVLVRMGDKDHRTVEGSHPPKEDGSRGESEEIANNFINRLDALLSENLDGLHKDFNTLKKGLLKCWDFIFIFLTDKNIPYDNNGSERGVRNIKVKQKVSGCFRTNLGADIYMKLHSVTDTTKKNGNSMFDALLAIAVLQR